jgi:uncharacterized Fe-S radical SAM superfamily protein PflX
MTERTALPDLDTLDHEALKALIFAQHEQPLSKDEQIHSKDEQLASRDEEIERRNVRGNRCQRICRVKRARSFRSRKRAPTVAAS